MSNLIKSASKMVFIVLTLTACVGFFLNRLSEENFMILAGAAFAYYFSYKAENKENLPYNGK